MPPLHELLKKAEVPDSSRPAEWPFLRLRGIARDVFGSLGGGEAFIRKERESFYPSPDRADTEI
jgi:hypothetical protein